MMMVHKLFLWAGSKSRSRRKKFINIWEEHSLLHQGGLISVSVPALPVDIIFQILFTKIGTWKLRTMIYGISYRERFLFTQRIVVCTLSLLMSSEVREWRDSPLNLSTKYTFIVDFVFFFFSYLCYALLLMFPWYLTSLYFFFLI